MLVNPKTRLLGYIDCQSNKDAYESPELSKLFQNLHFLEKPELAVLSELKEQLPEMKMLDLGVGGGRTTENFAPLVKEYVGVDYSKTMVDSCRKRFPEYGFAVMDARDLSSVENGSFDFVLFSMNGIDYVNHQDRLKILSEIRRVIKRGGYFYFSTHNLNNGPRICNFKFSRNPLMLLQEPRRIVLIRWFNRAIYHELRQKKTKYLIFKDGAGWFTLHTYFITPDEQIKQLVETGFKNVKIIDMQGKRVTDNLARVMDYWLGYFCIA